MSIPQCGQKGRWKESSGDFWAHLSFGALLCNSSSLKPRRIIIYSQNESFQFYSKSLNFWRVLRRYNNFKCSTKTACSNWLPILKTMNCCIQTSFLKWINSISSKNTKHFTNQLHFMLKLYVSVTVLVIKSPFKSDIKYFSRSF